MRLQRIGIVGGSGYIGFSLAKYLSQRFNVVILDVKPPPESSFALDFRLCDVRKYENVSSVLQDIDLVIDTAIVQIPLINEQMRLGYEVNIVGTHNVCRAADENSGIKGLILAGSWHTVGERKLRGVINEEFGFRPDKVEDRARLYALSKIAQESIVRFHDEMSGKVFGIIRMGTVLGDNMPDKTAASVFIENGLKGKPLTPFKHSMYRPMLYVDVNDVCMAYEVFARKIINDEIRHEPRNSLAHIFNVYYPEPVTIIGLAEMTRDAIIKFSDGRIWPEIQIVDTGQQVIFSEEDKKSVTADVSKAFKFLGLRQLKTSKESIEGLVRARIGTTK